MKQDRQGDQLAALGGVDRLVLDRAREGRASGLGGSDRRVDRSPRIVLELVDAVVHRFGQPDVEVDHDQRLRPLAPPQAPRLSHGPRARGW